jgi:hypothetical protein
MGASLAALLIALIAIVAAAPLSSHKRDIVLLRGAFFSFAATRACNTVM